ncbi:MAG: hypothetical protein HYV97_08435 [Bdellovibrio sp.]|nr:hypothetical protein [Bdellovibrio sp.]
MTSAIPVRTITQENWNYCCYKTARHRAFISMGGEYASNGETNIIYFSTVSDHDDQEIYQRAFHDLASALVFLNQTYGHWHYFDPSMQGQGCGSCHAH